MSAARRHVGRRRFPAENEAREAAFTVNLRAEMEGWPERYVVRQVGARWIVKARKVG